MNLFKLIGLRRYRGPVWTIFSGILIMKYHTPVFILSHSSNATSHYKFNPTLGATHHALHCSERWHFLLTLPCVVAMPIGNPILISSLYNLPDLIWLYNSTRRRCREGEREREKLKDPLALFWSITYNLGNLRCGSHINVRKMSGGKKRHPK